MAVNYNNLQDLQQPLIEIEQGYDFEKSSKNVNRITKYSKQPLLISFTRQITVQKYDFKVIFSSLIIFFAFYFLILVFYNINEQQHPPQRNIILFGDSLIRRSDVNFKLSINIQLRLRNLYPNYRIYVSSSGRDSNRMYDLKNRLFRDVIYRTGLISFLTWGVIPLPDIVIIYWDSDASDESEPLSYEYLQEYNNNVNYLLEEKLRQKAGIKI